MPFEPKTLEGFRLIEHGLRQTASEAQPFHVKRRIDAFNESTEIAEFVMRIAFSVESERKKSVAVVEDRGSSCDFVRVVVDQVAEVSHVPIRIEDERVKEENVCKSWVGEGFVS